MSNYISPSINQGIIYDTQAINRATNRNTKKKGVCSSQYNNSSNIEGFSTGAPPSTSSSQYSIPAEYKFTAIDSVNKRENNKMKNILKSVDYTNDLAVKQSQNTTSVAKNFLNSNNKGSLKNTNITTRNGTTAAVNALGIANTVTPYAAANSGVTFSTTAIDIPKSRNLEINQGANYPMISSGELGSTTRDTAILGQPAQLSLSAQNAIGKHAGKNVNIYDRQRIQGNNISYSNVYNSLPSSLTIQNDMNYNDAGQFKTVTARQCIERATDNAGQYGTAFSTVSNAGICYTGTELSGISSNAPFSYSNDLLLCEVFPGQEIDTIIFLGANGGLYNGFPSDNSQPIPKTNLLNTDLNSTVLKDVDPLYGAAINNVTASYGLSQGIENKNNMKFADSVSNNIDPTGQTSATFQTIRTITNTAQSCPWWMYNEWLDPWDFFLSNWFTRYIGGCETYYYNSYQSIIAEGDGTDLNIGYSCGKVKQPNITAQNVSAGSEYPIDCSQYTNIYGAMVLQIADNGVITITNTANTANPQTPVWSYTPVNSNNEVLTPLLSQNLTLKNNNTIPLNVQRADWVMGSGITSTNKIYTTTLFTYPNAPGGLTTFSPGEWLSSRSGLCRLILLKNPATGKSNFVIQYSLYNLEVDSSGYTVGSINPGGLVNGNDEAYAVHEINNVSANNIGLLSYVDLNNNVYSHSLPPSGAYPLAESYIESKNYRPSSGGTYQPSATSSTIGNICSNDPNCGGYYIDKNNGNCYTYDQSALFPYAQRIYDDSPNVSTFIREKKISQDMTHPSCSKQMMNITSDEYNNFGSYITGNNMTPDKKCELAVVLEQDIQASKIANANAIAKGGLVKAQMDDIYRNQNRAVNDLLTNNKKATGFENEIKEIDDKIQVAINNNLTKVAAKDNTELILVSDNYKYIIWGIITILLSMASIKALRIGSS